MRDRVMSLPLLRLQPITTAHYHVSGDVIVAEGVAIAPGVLIQADANSRIVIKAGVCIGAGSIIHAYNGAIEIGEGANIGAEVLLIGQVSIGDHACIGTASTILNAAISNSQVVSPGSLIGDNSRQADELQGSETNVIATPVATATVEPEPAIETAPPPAANGSKVNVYGQMYVNRMFVKLFPNSQPNSQPSAAPTSENPALSDDPWDD